MKLALDQQPGNSNIIRAYGPGSVTVNEEELTASCIVLPYTLIRHWRPNSPSELVSDDLLNLIELKPEIILLGTGRRTHYPAPDICALIAENEIGLEAMNTAAACRSYSVVASEGRQVAAALFMIEPEL